MICPKCKEDRAHRSHRKGLRQYIGGWFAFYPYRCHACEHRFLRFRYAPGSPSLEPTPTEREIRSTRNAIRWRRKKQELVLYLIGILVFLIFLYMITRPTAAFE